MKKGGVYLIISGIHRISRSKLNRSIFQNDMKSGILNSNRRHLSSTGKEGKEGTEGQDITNGNAKEDTVIGKDNSLQSENTSTDTKIHKGDATSNCNSSSSSSSNDQSKIPSETPAGSSTESLGTHQKTVVQNIGSAVEATKQQAVNYTQEINKG
jgi:hypothetical protein